MFGFGVRTSQVFTSRWKALLWSSGVLLTAYCSIPAADDHPAAGASQAAASDQARQQQQDVENAVRALSGN